MVLLLKTLMLRTTKGPATPKDTRAQHLQHLLGLKMICHQMLPGTGLYPGNSKNKILLISSIRYLSVYISYPNNSEKLCNAQEVP